MNKKETIAYVIFTALIVGIIILASISTTKTPITGAVPVTNDNVVCSGGDLNKISSSSLGIKNCDNYRNIFLKYMQEFDLQSIDILSLYALTYQESGCRPAPDGPTRCGGIMQVDSGCLNRPDCKCAHNVDFAIKTGLGQFSQKYSALSQKGISGSDAFKLVLFGYNRGTAAAERAADYLKSGMNLHDSMAKACDDFYPQSSIPGMCGSNWDYQRCCDSPGLGAGYPDKVLSYFEKACTEIGGEPSLGMAAFPGQLKELPIKYYLKPSFKVHIGYDFEKAYNELSKWNKDILEKVKSCFAEGKSPEECSKEDIGQGVSIIETLGNGKKTYTMKFDWSYAFEGKYNKDPLNYKFASVLTDTFIPPEIRPDVDYSVPNNKLDISWRKPSYDAEAYKIYCNNAYVSTVSTTSYSTNCVSGIVLGKTYTIRVIAIDNVGNENKGLIPASITPSITSILTGIVD